MKRVRVEESSRAIEAIERHAKRFRESGRTDADVEDFVRAMQADVAPVADFISALRRVRDADEVKQLLDVMTGGVILPELSQLVVGFMGPTTLISLTVVIIQIIRHQFAGSDHVEIYRYMDRFWRMLLERDFQSPCDQVAIDALYSDVKKGDGPQDDDEADRFINVNFPKRVTRVYPCVTNYIQLWDRLGSEGRQEDFPFYWKSAYLVANWFYRRVLNTFSGRYPLESQFASAPAGELPQVDMARHHTDRGDDLRHPYVEASKADLAPFDKRGAGGLENWAPTSWQESIAGNGRDIAQIQVRGIRNVMYSSVEEVLVRRLDSVQASSPLVSHGRNKNTEMRHGNIIRYLHPLVLAFGTSTTETTYQPQVVFSRKLPYVEEAWKTYGMSGHTGRSAESITCIGYHSLGIRLTFTPMAPGDVGMVKATSTRIDWPPPPSPHTSSRVRSNDTILTNDTLLINVDMLSHDTYAMVTNLGPALVECHPMANPEHGSLPTAESYPMLPEFAKKMHVPPRGRIFLLYDRYASIGLRANFLTRRGFYQGELIQSLEEKKTFVMPPARPMDIPGSHVVESRHFALRAIDLVAWAHWRRYSDVLRAGDYQENTLPEAHSYWDDLMDYLFAPGLEPDLRRPLIHLANFLLGNPLMTPPDVQAAQDEILASHVMRSAGWHVGGKSPAGKQIIYATESPPFV